MEFFCLQRAKNLLNLKQLLCESSNSLKPTDVISFAGLKLRHSVLHQCLHPLKTLKYVLACSRVLQTERCTSLFCDQSSSFVLTDLQHVDMCDEIQYGWTTMSVCVLCLLVKASLAVPGQRQQQMREAEHQSSRGNPLYILLFLQADPYEME